MTHNNESWKDKYHDAPESLIKIVDRERKAAQRELLDMIPDYLEYYQERAMPNKLKNDWDLTRFKQKLKENLGL